jgi:NADH-quinone oxidoreductase subunit L
VKPALRIGHALWKKGDDGVIDRFGPDGFAEVAVRLAQRASALETGYVYHYAFAMVIGVAAFITWFWLRS